MSILRRVSSFPSSCRNYKNGNSSRNLHLTTVTNYSDVNPKPTQPQDTDNKSEWSVIYRLPIIRLASAFNRLKFYQGGISIAGIPSAYILEQAAILPAGSGTTFAMVGLTGLMTLAFSSLFVQNLIGFIYIDKSGNRLKFSYVDYWGRRQDILLALDDLIPDGAQTKPTRFNFYQIIGSRNNENFKLKLLQRYGIVHDHYLFNELFY